MRPPPRGRQFRLRYFVQSLVQPIPPLARWPFVTARLDRIQSRGTGNLVAQAANRRALSGLDKVHLLFGKSGAKPKSPSPRPASANRVGKSPCFFRFLRPAKTAGLFFCLASMSKRAAARKFHARLAEQQANRFAELDRLAEEIRLELAKNPGMKAPADSGHPPELIALAGELRDRNRQFQDRAAQLLQEMNRRFAPSRFRMGPSTEGPTIELEPAGADAVPKAGKRSQQSQQLREANEWLAQTHREFKAAGEEATKTIQNYHASLDPKQAPGVEKLTESLVQAYLHRENWRRFADYRAAVLMPGLSPAQRRLLFNTALRDLEKHRLASMN